MSRVLVTGGAGFLVSHLCETLLEEGHEVIVMDNNVSGQTDNLEDIFYHDQFTFYEHDVTEFIHVSGDLDWVLHLASLGSPVFYKQKPIKTLKIGALGAHKTLGLAREKGAKYLFASTSEVYGDPEINLNSRATVETLIPTDHGPVTTNRNGTARQWYVPIGTSMMLMFGWPVFSIPTAHRCELTMGG